MRGNLKADRLGLGALREGGGALTVKMLAKRLDATMTYVV
jgi:hypothetical protein